MLYGQKLTSAVVDYLIDILISDLVDHNVASESVALPLARFARELKVAMVYSPADGESEYTRIRRSLRKSLCTMDPRFILADVLVKPRARGIRDELIKDDLVSV